MEKTPAAECSERKQTNLRIHTWTDDEVELLLKFQLECKLLAWILSKISVGGVVGSIGAVFVLERSLCVF